MQTCRKPAFHPNANSQFIGLSENYSASNFICDLIKQSLNCFMVLITSSHILFLEFCQERLYLPSSRCSTQNLKGPKWPNSILQRRSYRSNAGLKIQALPEFPSKDNRGRRSFQLSGSSAVELFIEAFKAQLKIFLFESTFLPLSVCALLV